MLSTSFSRALVSATPRPFHHRELPELPPLCASTCCQYGNKRLIRSNAIASQNASCIVSVTPFRGIDLRKTQA